MFLLFSLIGEGVVKYDYCVAQPSSGADNCPTTEGTDLFADYGTFWAYVKDNQADRLSGKTVGLGSTVTISDLPTSVSNAVTFYLLEAGEASTEITISQTLSSINWDASGITLNEKSIFTVAEGITYAGKVLVSFDNTKASTLKVVNAPTNAISLKGKLDGLTQVMTFEAAGTGTALMELTGTAGEGFHFVAKQVTPAVNDFITGIIMTSTYCFIEDGVTTVPTECSGNYYRMAAFAEVDAAKTAASTYYIGVAATIVDLSAYAAVTTVYVAQAVTITKAVHGIESYDAYYKVGEVSLKVPAAPAATSSVVMPMDSTATNSFKYNAQFTGTKFLTIQVSASLSLTFSTTDPAPTAAIVATFDRPTTEQTPAIEVTVTGTNGNPETYFAVAPDKGITIKIPTPPKYDICLTAINDPTDRTTDCAAIKHTWKDITVTPTAREIGVFVLDIPADLPTQLIDYDVTFVGAGAVTIRTVKAITLGEHLVVNTHATIVAAESTVSLLLGQDVSITVVFADNQPITPLIVPTISAVTGYPFLLTISLSGELPTGQTALATIGNNVNLLYSLGQEAHIKTVFNNPTNLPTTICFASDPISQCTVPAKWTSDSKPTTPFTETVLYVYSDLTLSDDFNSFTDIYAYAAVTTTTYKDAPEVTANKAGAKIGNIQFNFMTESASLNVVLDYQDTATDVTQIINYAPDLADTTHAITLTFTPQKNSENQLLIVTTGPNPAKLQITLAAATGQTVSPYVYYQNLFSTTLTMKQYSASCIGTSADCANAQTDTDKYYTIPDFESITTSQPPKSVVLCQSTTASDITSTFTFTNGKPTEATLTITAPIGYIEAKQDNTFIIKKENSDDQTFTVTGLPLAVSSKPSLDLQVPDTAWIPFDPKFLVTVEISQSLTVETLATELPANDLTQIGSFVYNGQGVAYVIAKDAEFVDKLNKLFTSDTAKIVISALLTYCYTEAATAPEGGFCGSANFIKFENWDSFVPGSTLIIDIDTKTTFTLSAEDIVKANGIITYYTKDASVKKVTVKLPELGSSYKMVYEPDNNNKPYLAIYHPISRSVLIDVSSQSATITASYAVDNTDLFTIDSSKLTSVPNTKFEITTSFDKIAMYWNAPSQNLADNIGKITSSSANFKAYYYLQQGSGDFSPKIELAHATDSPLVWTKETVAPSYCISQDTTSCHTGDDLPWININFPVTDATLSSVPPHSYEVKSSLSPLTVDITSLAKPMTLSFVPQKGATKKGVRALIEPQVTIKGAGIEFFDDGDIKYIPVGQEIPTADIYLQLNPATTTDATTTDATTTNVIVQTPDNFQIHYNTNVPAKFSVTQQVSADQINLKASAGSIAASNTKIQFVRPDVLQAQVIVTGVDDPAQIFEPADDNTIYFREMQAILVCADGKANDCKAKSPFPSVDEQSIIISSNLFIPKIAPWLDIKYTICLTELTSPFQIDITLFVQSTQVISFIDLAPDARRMLADTTTVSYENVQYITTDNNNVAMSAEDTAKVASFAYVPSGIQQQITVGQNVEVTTKATVLPPSTNSVFVVVPSETTGTTIKFTKGAEPTVQFAVNKAEDRKIVVQSGSKDDDETIQKIFGDSTIDFVPGPVEPESSSVEVPPTTTKGGGFPGGAIAGIVIAVIVVVALAIIIPIVIIKKKGRDDDGARV